MSPDPPSLVCLWHSLHTHLTLHVDVLNWKKGHGRPVVTTAKDRCGSRANLIRSCVDSTCNTAVQVNRDPWVPVVGTITREMAKHCKVFHW